MVFSVLSFGTGFVFFLHLAIWLVAGGGGLAGGAGACPVVEGNRWHLHWHWSAALPLPALDSFRTYQPERVDNEMIR
jgi:hypothetical protein